MIGAVGAVLLFGGGDEEAAAPPGAPDHGEARAPSRAEFRSGGPKARAGTALDSAKPRPVPANASEIEAVLEEDPAGALASLESLTPANDAEAERLAALEIRALVGAGRMGKARGQASRYYERWPNGASTALIEQLTGAHPQR